MTHQIAHDGTGYQVYATANGIERTDVGPRWQTPDAASVYCDALDLAAPSAPLSGEGAGPTGLPVPDEARVSQGAHGAPRNPAPAVPHRAPGRDNTSR